jgi:hypothetical protein
VKHAALALLMAAGAAQADVVAIIQRDNMRLELHNTQGPCQREARYALLTNGRTRISGCWVLMVERQEVAIAWLDGDWSAVPISLFKEPEKL